MSKKNFARDLERTKAESTLQLLFKAARLLNERALARARPRNDFPSLRAAHTSLLPHIDLEGTRISELSRRVGISKQAVSQLVDDLEAYGTCVRVPDPKDGRAKLVRFSAAGQRQLLDGLALLRELEAELAREIGQRRMKELNSTLQSLLATKLVSEASE